jgi:hypothetical protein
VSRFRAGFSVFTWTSLCLVTALGVADAVLAPAPASSEPDFVDTILSSRAVIASIRITIVFAAIFVVLSVVALIVRKQWLTRVGPVEVFDVGAERQQLEDELGAANRTIEDLKSEVAVTQQLVDREGGT